MTKAKFELSKEVIHELKESLSEGRPLLYLAEARGDDKKALELYAWNTLLCQSLYGPLQCFEVTLRNRVDKVLCKVMGDKWFESDYWIAGEKKRIEEAIYHIRENAAKVPRRLDGATARSKLPTGVCRDNIVAELSLGFWLALFDGHREKKFWTELRKIFVNGPKGLTRETASSRIEEARELRNCVAHYEPVFDRQLPDLQDSMIEFVSWMSPHTAEWMRAHSQLQSVWDRPPIR